MKCIAIMRVQAKYKFWREKRRISSPSQRAFEIWKTKKTRTWLASVDILCLVVRIWSDNIRARNSCQCHFFDLGPKSEKYLIFPSQKYICVCYVATKLNKFKWKIIWKFHEKKPSTIFAIWFFIYLRRVFFREVR